MLAIISNKIGSYLFAEKFGQTKFSVSNFHDLQSKKNTIYCSWLEIKSTWENIYTWDLVLERLNACD